MASGWPRRRCTRAVRLFVASLDMGDDNDGSETIAIINPEITPVSNDMADDWEGCLSIPDIAARCRAIPTSGSGLDRNGERLDFRATNFSARDSARNRHLDGILFFDRMKSFETLTFLDEYSRYWSKREDDDEE